MGLSFLLPSDVSELDVVLRWGDYARSQIEDEDGKTDSVWQRRPREVKVPVTLGGDEEKAQPVPDSGGLQLHLVERAVTGPEMDHHLPAGTRSISVFLVNDRPPDTDQPDLAYVFQAAVEVRSEAGFVPRPDPRGTLAEEWDEQVADLHYADCARVRDRAWGVGRMGGRRGVLSGGSHGMDPLGRGGEDDDRRRARP